MTDESLAIDLTNVTKVYRRKVRALSGVDLRVRRGEIFGLLGPNGAGKSTLVKIMMTVVRPTTAAGTILNHPVGNKATLAYIGYLPENHRYPRYLTGRQTVEFFSALSGIGHAERRKRAAELLDVVGMQAWADTRIGQYSKGMMQRIGMATALAANPELVVLDEPTDGVDPVGRRDIREVLLRLRGEGKTVLINSHLLSELESVCDRVAVLVKGRIATQGTMQELTGQRQFYLFEPVNGTETGARVLAALPGVFANPPQGATFRGSLPNGTWCDFDGSLLRVGTTDPLAAQEVLDALRRQALVIKRMHVVRPSLEQLFIETVNESGATP